ncbi:MAG TPA: peptide chain release factor N(5)-glutamine methyltransferase [Devosia sp.]|nr:peptide chain release factor N(5)-glutamine methyltransferase [Devosia sp.]
MTTIGAAWRGIRDRFRGAELDTPELDARLLAEAAFGLDRLALSMREGEGASADGLARLEGYAERRLAGEPVARLLGHKEFYGLDFELNAATLVPRPETEMLVDEALAAIGGLEAPLLLDLGTGSGCIAIAVLAHAPKARAVATELSPAAIEAARRNAVRHGVAERLSLRQGSWCEPLMADEIFDAVVSNPPYVETDIIGQLAPEVGSFDPRLALDGGEDGLEAYRAIAAGLPGHLRPGARLMIEIGSEQGIEVGALLSTAGFSQIDIKKDLAGLDRVVVAHQLG